MQLLHVNGATKTLVLNIKRHGTINCHKEFDPDVLNTFCVTWVEKLQILQRMYELISTLATQRICSFESQFLLKYYTR